MESMNGFEHAYTEAESAHFKLLIYRIEFPETVFSVTSSNLITTKIYSDLILLELYLHASYIREKCNLSESCESIIHCARSKTKRERNTYIVVNISSASTLWAQGRGLDKLPSHPEQGQRSLRSCSERASYFIHVYFPRVFDIWDAEVMVACCT